MKTMTQHEKLSKALEKIEKELQSLKYKCQGMFGISGQRFAQTSLRAATMNQVKACMRVALAEKAVLKELALDIAKEKYSGYTLKDWITDMKTRVRVLKLNKAAQFINSTQEKVKANMTNKERRDLTNTELTEDVTDITSLVSGLLD